MVCSLRQAFAWHAIVFVMHVSANAKQHTASDAVHAVHVPVHAAVHVLEYVAIAVHVVLQVVVHAGRCACRPTWLCMPRPFRHTCTGPYSRRCTCRRTSCRTWRLVCPIRPSGFYPCLSTYMPSRFSGTLLLDSRVRLAAALSVPAARSPHGVGVCV